MCSAARAGCACCCRPSALCSATSPLGKASGQRRARIAMYCAVQSPIPGNSLSAAIVADTSTPALRFSCPLATARASAWIAPWRWRTTPKLPSVSALAPARAWAVGNKRLSCAWGVVTLSPHCCTKRCASVRAAATVICWPSTARTASSKPSHEPGTRRPSPCGNCACSTALMACGSASRSKQWRTRRITCGSTWRRLSLTCRCNWGFRASNHARNQP